MDSICKLFRDLEYRKCNRNKYGAKRRTPSILKAILVGYALSFCGAAIDVSDTSSSFPASQITSKMTANQIRKRIKEAKLPSIVARVIGGQAAVDGRYPYAQISLQLGGSNTGGNNHQCGASLIAPDMVLTAAHCNGWFTKIHLNQYDFAENIFQDKYEIMTPVSMSIHPKFHQNIFRYDFAVVKLSAPALNINPVRLNSNASVPAENTTLTVVGWGATNISNPNSPVYPDVFQKGNVRALTNDQCRNFEVYNNELYQNEIYPEMLCAYGTGVDACSGDSGSPLILEGARHRNPISGAIEYNDVQVGIVSWGRGCAIYPGVYSRVSSGYDWIREKVCELSQSPPEYFQCNTTTTTSRPTSLPTPDPRLALEYSTPVPTMVSTRQQQSSTRGQVHQDSGIKQLATISPTTTPSLVSVLIEIQLDENSAETGWYITTFNNNVADSVVVQVPAGAYQNIPNQRVAQTIFLNQGNEYLFVITDTGRNGIRNGWYRVSVLFQQKDNLGTVRRQVAVPVIQGTGIFASRAQQILNIAHAEALYQANPSQFSKEFDSGFSEGGVTATDSTNSNSHDRASMSSKSSAINQGGAKTRRLSLGGEVLDWTTMVSLALLLFY